jgi:hypothetical protein
MRWREMHQSGRVAIMLEMRSSPQAGSHLTLFFISSRARWRKVVGEPSGFVIGVIDIDEPLFGGAEDDGVVAAPAVRVAVKDVGAAEQRAARGDQIDDGLVGLENGLAVVFGQAVADASGIVDVAGLIEAVARAGVEVVGAVGGRGVDGAGSLIGGDVVGEDAEDGAIEERMLEGCAFETRAFEGGDDARRISRLQASRTEGRRGTRRRCRLGRLSRARRTRSRDERRRRARRAASREWWSR